MGSAGAFQDLYGVGGDVSWSLRGHRRGCFGITTGSSAGVFQGHYGVVYKGQLETASGTQVIAIKCLHKQMYHKYFKEFEREIRVMQTLHHVNIVRLIGHLPQRSAGKRAVQRPAY